MAISSARIHAGWPQNADLIIKAKRFGRDSTKLCKLTYQIAATHRNSTNPCLTHHNTILALRRVQFSLAPSPLLECSTSIWGLEIFEGSRAIWQKCNHSTCSL